MLICVRKTHKTKAIIRSRGRSRCKTHVRTTKNEKLVIFIRIEMDDIPQIRTGKLRMSYDRLGVVCDCHSQTFVCWCLCVCNRRQLPELSSEAQSVSFYNKPESIGVVVGKRQTMQQFTRFKSLSAKNVVVDFFFSFFHFPCVCVCVWCRSVRNALRSVCLSVWSVGYASLCSALP